MCDVNHTIPAAIATAGNNKPVKLPYRILIVDDEPDVTLSLKMGLEQEQEEEEEEQKQEVGTGPRGFVVDTSNDPVQTLSHFKPGVYDLLVIDIKMPKMNGFELYKEIRKIDDNVKVCFLTVQDTKKDRFTFTTIYYPLGMFDYVSSQIQTLKG